MGIAGAALMAVVLCSAGLPAHAEEIPVGVPYGTTIGELKADAPAQCLVVQTGDYTFQKMMAELGDTAVVVQDIGDGTRLCHIPASLTIRSTPPARRKYTIHCCRYWQVQLWTTRLRYWRKQTWN